ncbi:hypothetical protein GALMADRAFT_253641 [Galerina marginata CBS 339.88]|uniref:Uncharacterized protein n=1 Tax=Galerina marginata (strain CBS 339.88) TaxID=685588 RepID=A0A067SLP4_GALM3|nr:hypothetical protein GALMADRAFT_253641 [Galerina marginata CBS 339.88]
MAQVRRRVSYIIPSPSETPPRLQLPPHGVSRLGATGPLLTLGDDNDERRLEGVPEHQKQPRHRLGVASLALDTSTQLTGRGGPEGILYSGGRDGLVMSWDLGIPMKKRKHSGNPNITVPRGRWEALTGWDDDFIEEENEDGDQRPASDGDILGEVKMNSDRRRRAASLAGEIPHERQWETDLSAFEPGTRTQFRQCSQAHTDWVNDILLCNHNQTVVSASSDGTVKAWNPHSSIPTDPSTIGTHSDYVRCLTYCREQSWVASASFDRCIKLWDLSRSSATLPLVTMTPPDATAPKSSVYALAADPFGRTVVSGSPERVVRLWDPRTGKRTGKLVGHTDNIRAILISEDSKYLLTGSADATIKLWSLSSQRCLHTFTHHTDSVWSLFSDHPSLEVFYSGDRSGLVCRVDVENSPDLSEGECVLLCNDSADTRSSSEGINKIVVMDDNLLWTASGTSTIRRWNIPQRRASRPSSITPAADPDGERLYVPFKRKAQGEAPSEASTRPSTGQGQSRRMSSSPSVHSLASEQWKDRENETKMNGLPYDSLIKLVSPDDPFVSYSSTRTRDPEVATLYSAASIMSVPRQTSRSSQNIFQSSSIGSPLQSSRTEETMMIANTARALFEDRDLAADALPFCSEPDDVIPGDHGLVRSIILNDRINALTVDTAGQVAVWDIVRGKCLGRYLPEDVAAASHSGSIAGGSGDRERSPREALEAVRERIEGEGVASSWCNADTKGGVLTIHITERCFEAEVYADEVGFANNHHFNDESKLNIGKWVLRNLFIGFIQEELRSHIPETQDDKLSRNPSQDNLDQNLRTRFPSSTPDSVRKQAKHSTTSTVLRSPKMVPAVAPNVPNAPRASPLLAPLIPLHTYTRDRAPSSALPPIPQSPPASSDVTPMPGVHQRTRSGTIDGSGLVSPNTSKEDYFSVRTRQQPIQGGIPGSPDDFSGWTGPNKAEPQTPLTPSGLIGRLKSFGKITKRPVSDIPNMSTLPTPAEIPNEVDASAAQVQVELTPLQKILAGPLNPPASVDAPLYPLAPNTTVLISEEAQPSYTTIYRRNVGNIHNDVEAVETAMPIWLAEYLLLNRTPPLAPLTKLSFVLMPWNKDPDGEPLPELLNTTQSKLTASRYLRVRKIVSHVQDKLDKISQGTGSRSGSIRLSIDGEEPPRASRPRAEDEYEILCNDTLLPLGMSLAAVRQYVWKQGAELVMHYRRKRPLQVNPFQ